MGTMNKLRDNTGVILWILVISFGVLWVLQDSGAFDAVGQMAGTNIIVVNGDAITYDEYNRALDARLEQYQSQAGESMPPQMVDLERDRVFEALVMDKLREHEIRRLGITVTDDELADMVLGENPHPIIQMYFGDGQGGINRSLLQNFIEDPQASEQWIQLEEFLRQQRRTEKLNQLVSSTVRITDQDVLDEYQKRNRSADVEYVALRYASLPDDSIQVTDRDLRSFYNENRSEFERKRTYTVNYVSVSKQPTSRDTALVMNELERLRPRFAEAEDDSTFLMRNASERPYTDAFFRADELEDEVAAAVFSNLEEGNVLGPVVSGNEAHLIKIKEVRPAEEPVVRARHILFRATEDDASAREEARREAEQTKARLEDGASFAELARELSDDPGSAQNGGDLGWFGRGRMVEPFEQAAFDAPVGRVVGPVATQYGYHLIEVTQRANQEVQLADFAMAIRPDIETLSSIQEQLDDLQYYASESGDFADEAQRRNLEAQQVQIEDEQQFIPGIGNSRTLMNFLQNGSKGEISPVIELNDQFIVAEIEQIQPAGYRPFEEVRNELEPRVRIAKKREILSQRMNRALAQAGFDGLAEALGTTKRTVDAVKFNDPVVPALGREPQFTGTALGLEEGAVSKVVEGENAVFVIKTIDINEPAPITDAQREQIRSQLLDQRRATVMNQWLASLRDEAEVEDLRSRFQQ